MSARYEVRGLVAVITMDNPPVNGLGYDTRVGIAAGVERAWADAAVQAIVVTGAGNVIRRNTIDSFNNTLLVQSNLAGDTLVFSPDGLTRTTGNAVINGQQIIVCSTTGPAQNRREVTLGASSRISTASTAGACS